MFKSHIFMYTLVAALLLSACSTEANTTGDSPTGSQYESASGSPASSPQTATTITASDKVKNEDLDASWDEKTATRIALNGDSIAVSGGGASVSGSMVTITAAGIYVVSGTLTDGQIIVNASENALVRLVLNGAELSNSSTSPIYCEKADKLLVILADGSTNTVADSDSYVFPNAETDEPNAAIFSDTDLTINGTGTLTVNAKYNNGIGTKDDLIIVSGTLDITAPNDAVRGRDSVTVIDANLTLNAGGDGIQANNDTAGDKGWIELYGGTFDITAAHDGIQAETWLTVTGGGFRIIAGGGSANASERAAETRGGGRQGGMMNQTPGQQPGGEGQSPQGQRPGGEGQRPQGQRPGGGGQMPQGQQPGSGGQIPPIAGFANEAYAFSGDMFAGVVAETGDASAEDTASDSFKGIKAGMDLAITGGNFEIDSADDALHADGNASVSGGDLTLSTGDDGIHADGDLVIGGSAKIDILTSYEGIEGATVTVSDGNISIVASDDGINAAGGAGGSEGGMFGQDRFNSASGKYWIRVEGGSIDITAGFDGIDSNGDIDISGGDITLNMTNLNSVGGDGMIDKDGAMTITGGNILGAGGNGVVTMGRGSGDSASTQPILQLYYTSTQTAGSLVELKDADGNTVATLTPKRDFKCVIFSVPELNDGESYSVYTGSEKTLELTLSDTITLLQDTGEVVSQSMGGRNPGRGNRSAAPINP